MLVEGKANGKVKGEQEERVEGRERGRKRERKEERAREREREREGGREGGRGRERRRTFENISIYRLLDRLSNSKFTLCRSSTMSASGCVQGKCVAPFFPFSASDCHLSWSWFFGCCTFLTYPFGIERVP